LDRVRLVKYCILWQDGPNLSALLWDYRKSHIIVIQSHPSDVTQACEGSGEFCESMDVVYAGAESHVDIISRYGRPELRGVAANIRSDRPKKSQLGRGIDEFDAYM
jgi:hypothetical protein